MKQIGIILLFLITPLFLFAQFKTDKIKTSEIYLDAGSKKVKFNDIHPQTIVKLLGKPLHILKERSEVTNEMIVTYSYKEGDIDFEENNAAFIEIKNPGWAFSFVRKNFISKPLAIGADYKEVKNIFPDALFEKQINSFRLWIIDDTGETMDQSVLFEIKNNKIKALSFFSDES